MTVKELIEELQTFPQDAPIAYYNNENRYYEIADDYYAPQEVIVSVAKGQDKNGNWIITPVPQRVDVVIPESIVAELIRIYGYEKIRDAIRVSVPNTSAVTKLISAHGELFVDYEVVKGKMDDVFLAVTGKNLPGGGIK